MKTAWGWGALCSYCLLSAGCELAIPFETIPEGTGGSSGSAGSSQTTTTSGSGAGGGSSTTTTGAGGTGGSTNPTPCLDDAGCNDGIECTEDICQSGFCVFSYLWEGTTPPSVSDVPDDCKRIVCLGPSLTSVVDTTQTPADPDPNDCMELTCDDAGNVVVAPADEGSTCAPNEQCKIHQCKDGICTSFNINEGVVVMDGGADIPEGSGDCRDTVCQNGQPALVPNFLNCYDMVPGNCTIRPCSANGICGAILTAPAGTPCDNDGNGTLNSVCNGSTSTCP